MQAPPPCKPHAVARHVVDAVKHALDTLNFRAAWSSKGAAASQSGLNRNSSSDGAVNALACFKRSLACFSTSAVLSLAATADMPAAASLSLKLEEGLELSL